MLGLHKSIRLHEKGSAAMPLLTYHRNALVAISVALAGCAGVAPTKDASVLSSAKADRLAPGVMALKQSDAQPPLELDGAIAQAQAERKNGDLAGAMKTLSQLVLVAPDDPRVVGEYGKTLVANGRSDDALAFLERAIQLQPTDWSLFSAQGVAFDQKSDYRQAQISYGRALALRPGEPTVLSNNALSHMQSGDLEEAERLLLEAAQAGGDFPRISSNLALVQSLKASREAAAHRVPARTVVEAPAPIEVPPPAMTPDVASVPDPVPQTSPDAVPNEVVNAPVHRAELPTPTGDFAASAMMLRPTTAEELAMDPTVRMQAIPKDEHAGPVVMRKRIAPETRVAAKQTAKSVAASKTSEDSSKSLLRPTLDTAAADPDE